LLLGPEECDTVTYKISQSYSEYPTLSYAKSSLFVHANLQTLFANANTDDEKYNLVKRNVMQLNFFYEDLVYTKIEEAVKIEIVTKKFQSNSFNF
jgi:hypothetical protein